MTAKILQNLTIKMEPYADVKVQALDKTITEQQGSDFARAEGENKKAAIVIWGDYGVSPSNVLISVHFEVLKPPANFPKLGEEARGQARNLNISQLDHFELQEHLSKEMLYLSLFTLGMVQYERENWNEAIAVSATP